MPNKKDAKPKMTTITTKAGEKIKVFEDLETFETFIRNGAEDNEFDNVRAQANYYPPFIVNETHDDPEKIKDTENSHSKKFVRHVHQHVEKHLLKDIKISLQHPDMKFHDKHKVEDFNGITWTYDDETELNGKKFKIDIVVKCHHDDAMVSVDYTTTPVA